MHLADLATGRERPMTTGGRAEKSVQNGWLYNIIPLLLDKLVLV